MSALRRIILVGAGPLIVVAGGASYFLYFARFSTLRDIPWVNLPLVAFGLLYSLCLVRHPSAGRIAALILSSLGTAGFCYYIFGLSYQLPPPTNLVMPGMKAPAVDVTGPRGTPIHLADYKGKELVLVFYRGYW